MSSQFGLGGISTISYHSELLSDNLTLADLTDVGLKQLYTNNLASIDNVSTPYWAALYKSIYEANAAIEGVSNSKKLTSSVKNRILGEAYFDRAFMYYYLVNLYGDVPLALTTDYKLTSVLKRSAAADVYNQIVNDLLQAKDYLDSQYLDFNLKNVTTERVRPNQMAAYALLARVQLQRKNYLAAEEAATKVIENKPTYNIVAPEQVFLKNSDETIWALQPVRAFLNTNQAQIFILPVTGPDFSYPVYLSNSLVNSFESNNDLRKSKWIGSVIVGSQTYYFSYKYKVPAIGTDIFEYDIVLRLAEQYLIRSEARAEQNKISDAQADLNIIRSRAGLANTVANNTSDLKAAILKERRVELFTEWGHRWIDIKRTGTIDQIMTQAAVVKGSTWESFKALFPIPYQEIVKDSQLTQNTGY
ncbi:putative outer membrane starch-binding protein [Mucilaginibacter gracilis]|uniref:Putative outer membrane starch-binding protein n=1 Tax=Mucilaginibacter gracilis TaxID=423350 RepID=A0A495J239_9SPHI|nr:putative outer membrane starch-binding protein [Mucilaginibacter gracilis]